MNEITGAITYPQGFLAAGVRSGIKQQGEDIALIFSEREASSAAVFTTNIVKAAPVLVSRDRVRRRTTRAVIVNSGNANACTGEQGMRDALEMTTQVAELLNISADDVIVASTGVIGHTMPMDKVRGGISEAVRSLSRDGTGAARAIMTTDTRPKEATAEVSIGGKAVRIGGIAKGAGMICPNMATLLMFITTDAAIRPEMLQECLRQSAEVSVNCLSIDGDSSTNDSLIVLANGGAGNNEITAPGPDLDAFRKGLDSVTTSLAKQIAADGEGATKMIEVMVTGAGSFDDARLVAKTIANSPLVKTAMFGCDPNWGRVLAAAGRSGIDFDPKAVRLTFGNIVLLDKGEPISFDGQEASDLLKKPEVRVLLEIGAGPASATVWTCDFSYDYVKINAEYHT